jgi:hypothetical protein
MATLLGGNGSVVSKLKDLAEDIHPGDDTKRESLVSAVRQLEDDIENIPGMYDWDFNINREDTSLLPQDLGSLVDSQLEDVREALEYMDQYKEEALAAVQVATEAISDWEDENEEAE